MVEAINVFGLFLRDKKKENSAYFNRTEFSSTFVHIFKTRTNWGTLNGRRRKYILNIIFKNKSESDRLSRANEWRIQRLRIAIRGNLEPLLPNTLGI